MTRSSGKKNNGSVFPTRSLLHWYGKNRRDLPWRRSGDIYNIWLSEVMLQQTQVATVIPYYEKFLKFFPTVSSLARAFEHDVLRLWQGLGYYSRARNFHKAARMVCEHYQGVIPEDPGEFGKLPGVGSYIAAAVLSIAAGSPLPVVDGNVLRVYTRFNAITADIAKNSTKKLVYKKLSEIIPVKTPGDFNQAWMELGATICTPRNPGCRQCPIQLGCQSFARNEVHLFPVKKKRGPIPTYPVAIAVILDHGRFFVQKRPSSGHLGGFWEFPGGKIGKNESLEQALIRECQEEIGVTPKIKLKLMTLHHAYTHFAIDLHVFICRLPAGQKITSQNPTCWITPEEIPRFPFPGANHKIFPRLMEYLRNNKRL